MRPFNSHRLAFIAMAVAAFAHPCTTLPAQGPAKTQIDIAVSDTSGAVVPDAVIQIDPIPCVSETAAKTDNKGVAVIQVASGVRTIVVISRGFMPWSKQIDAQDGVKQTISVTLRVGQGGGVEVTPYVDLVLFNGTILSGECLKEAKPKIVSAIAIGAGKVIAVGSDAEIKSMAGTGTQTKLRDLHGAFVMPGLNDAHTHLGGAGQTKLNVDLTDSKSLDEMLHRIEIKAKQSKAGHWLTGGGWDHTLWANKTLPSRQDLDRVTGGHPTLLERIDGHIAVANSAALKAAGVNGKSKAPQGGAIDLDANGEPTGILRDTAMEEVESIIPPPSHEDRIQGLTLAMQDAISHGLTSVQDYSDWQDFLVFEELEKENKLPIRISEWLTFNDPIDVLKDHRAHHDQNDTLLHTGMLKGFMDGSLGSHTAAMKAPFADEPKNSGLPRYDQAKLNAMAVERAQAGFQLGFHAIGDRAAAMALEAFAQPVSDFPGKTVAQGHRDRIEHAQVVDPADIARFAKLGVIASMQPNHLLTDMNWAMDRLGPQRAAYSYAWKAFLDAGVVVAFGTDYPVEPVTPFRGLYAAVTRANEAGTKTYFPESRLTRTQALYAYTQGSAYAEFAEGRKGKLAPGYEADFILLDRNLLTVPALEILKTQVLETVVGGKTVYQAKQ
jgi:predicted amidohydrolase YtcJ